MRFIDQKASILAKMAVVLANTEFGKWIGTHCLFVVNISAFRPSSLRFRRAPTIFERAMPSNESGKSRGSITVGSNQMV
jgi:hypothetical protein